MKPIRTALFAPGSNSRVMAKALESGADAVILDLEDSVAIAAKPDARKLVAAQIDTVAAVRGEGKSTAGVFVRTNSPATGMLEEDLNAAVRLGLDMIFLPKAETVDEIAKCAALLNKYETAKGMRPGTVDICLMIESALGVYNCYQLIKASKRVTATCIGSARDGDLQTDLGCAWSIEGTELLYAKSKVLCDTRAAGAYPLDGVYSDINDEAGLIKDSTASARLGFLGRTPIHPKQIAPIRRAYAVPEAEVAWYTRVVSEFEAAEKTGVAAIAVEGKLIDYAMYQRAKRVLALASLDGKQG
ncbi:MAG: CoA ester lyase [Betaproteobacteria bacterium]|nr:CoA ester lyase [Betaproteobacteria bacterium]